MGKLIYDDFTKGGRIPNRWEQAVKDAIDDNDSRILNNAAGWWDYNDLLDGQAIAITGGTGFANLMNDGAGPQSISTYKPFGITNIWDAANDRLDFSEMKLGDQIIVRASIEVTTTALNTDLSLQISLGSAFPYSILMISDFDVKTVKTYKTVTTTPFYIGNQDTLDNPGYIQLSASDDVTVKVNGWYISVIQA